MTYIQEQKSRMSHIRAHGFEFLPIYIYTPGNWDEFDPKVIAGYPIRGDAEVIITKDKIDPMRKFVFIMDRNGNEQSVFKSSLKRKVK